MLSHEHQPTGCNLARSEDQVTQDSMTQDRATLSETAREAYGESLRDSPKRFVNRELSWLEFNRRVLLEASNEAHPLLERVRFVSISANNLDEFFMVRVAGLRGQLRSGVETPSDDGLTPGEQLPLINERVGVLAQEQLRCWRQLQDQLLAEGIAFVDPEDL